MQDYAVQFSALSELKEALGVLSHNLGGNMAKMDISLQGLSAEGLPKQIAQNFGAYWGKNRKQLEKVVTSIGEVGIPYVNKNLIATEENWNAAKAASEI